MVNWSELKKEIKEMTWSEIIRLGLFLSFLIFSVQYMMKYVTVKQSFETMTNVYYFHETIVPNTNISNVTAKIVSNAYADSFVWQTVFNIVLLAVSWIVLYHYFVKPKYIFREGVF